MQIQICSLLRGGIAERGGVRVGHRIIEINNQSVVAVPHEKIVNLLATSVGEVRITSLFCRPFMSIELDDVFTILDIDENDADEYVPTTNWPRESSLHLSDFNV